MHAGGKSDGCVVPKKPPNKDGHDPSAEAVEGRRPTKGNTLPSAAPRTQSRTSASIGLQRVREVARRDRRARFTALLHHVTIDLLRESFYALKRDAAPGVDGLTWQQYEAELEDRLADLHRRVHKGTYRAQPSRRVYIPKSRWPPTPAGHRGPGGQDRPAGRGDGAQCDLRGGLPGLLLRIPTRTQPARCAGCALGGDHGKEGELGARCRHPGFLRYHRPRMADEVPRAPDRRPKGAPPDPQMASGWGI